jgi:hypothetical protein
MISKSVPARARTRTFAVGIDYVTEHTHQRAVAAAGATFEGGVTYASAPEKAAWVHLRGVTSVETAALEMEAVAALSSRCRDPVYHLIIAYAKHERPTREQVVSDTERLLKAIGMDDHQYVLAAHKDTDDFHAHVIANRVGPDGRANDLWHERIIRERVCAEIAAERGWDIVVGHHNRDIVQRIERLHDLPPDPEWRISDGAYRRLHEHGELPWQDIARPYVLDAVDRARDWSDLHQRLAAHGVVVKLVQRGGRVQGLAFAEGLDRNAPGCAASRIDARCALSKLERRFGSFTPPHEPTPAIQRGEPWFDTVRPTILAAVDAANSWDDLKHRLDRHGIVIKLVARGGRVQGLAFAQGSHRDARGCAASRIDPRCKKAALEQRFGPYPRDEQQRQEQGCAGAGKGEAQPHKRERLRERAARQARNDPGWALREASHIVDHARMQSGYAAFRDQFFGDRSRAIDAHRNAAWQRERAQRQIEARRRREARQLLRTVARVGARGLVARQVSYWSIDAVMTRRRAQEYDTARVRWETTKIVLASERGLVREEKPMDYRSFVTEKARAGDYGAQRVLDMLVAPARSQDRTASSELRQVSLNEVRARLDVIRAEEKARHDRARGERERLQRLARPTTLDEALAVARKRVESQTTDATQFTHAERMRLSQLAAEQRSWNPLTRAAASKAGAGLQAMRRSRYAQALAVAMREFEGNEVPQITKRVAADEWRYRQYVAASLALEEEMREARSALRDRIPRAEQEVNILERAGISSLEGCASRSNAPLSQLAAVIDQQYQGLPDSIRRSSERSVKREQRTRARSRESISMGDR